MSQLKAMPGDTPDEFTDHTGIPRKLASLPDTGGRFKSLPSFGANYPVLDKKDFREVSRRSFDKAFGIFDQGQHGSCVGNGWAMGLSKARVVAGMKPLLLSPAFWYSLMNGNQDNGAIISDGIATGQQVGTCLFSTVGQDPIYQSQMPKSAKTEAARFRLGNAYQPQTYAEIVTALLMPKAFIVIFGYQVGSNFENFDKYGVGGHSRGPGNHCNHADGVKLLPDGRWVLDTPNSWRPDWGPWANGRFYIDEDHLYSGGDQPDVCIIDAAAEDPQDSHIPPVAA